MIMKITKERMHFENDLRELKRSKKKLNFQQMSKIGYKQNAENKQVPTSPAFKSAQDLGRAFSRTRRALSPALPSTPKRKHAVWQRLSNKYGDSSSAETTPTRSLAISEETKALVTNFYERDDKSPGTW